MGTKPNLLRATIAGDVICKQCHVPFLQNLANAELSHPIVADYAAFAADPRFKPSVVNVSGADVRLVNGGVSCTTCHSTHFADSAALTGVSGVDNNTNYVAGTLAPGDGNLLRADGPLRTGANQNATAQIRSNLCQACHTYKMHGKTLAEEPTAVQVGCLDCHGGHSRNGGVPSVYILRNSVDVVASPRGILATPGTVTVDSYLKPYAFGGAENYQRWSDRLVGPSNGYCEKCHGDVESDPILSAAASGHVSTALVGCDSCHHHDATGWTYSFKPDVSAANCGDCHGFPPHINAAGNRPSLANPIGDGTDGGYTYSEPDGGWNYFDDSGSFKDESQSGHLTHAGGHETNFPNFYFVGASGTDNCNVCHGDNSGFNSRHRNSPDVAQNNPNKVAGGDPTSFRDVPFNSVAATPGKPAPVYKETVGGDPQWSCSNVECHSNGGPADDAGARTYTVLATPAWQTAINGVGVHLFLNAADRCSKCHGGTKADMVTKLNSSAHGKHIDSLTYNYGCNVCHAGTASSSTALKPLATLGNKSAVGGGKHVNKAVEVEYDGTVLSGNLATSTWTAAGGTCSTYCHSDGVGTIAAPDWQKANQATCISCHKGTVASGTAMSTGSHGQHINGTVATIGRQMGCVECHSTTVSNDTTVSTPANHVNVTKDIGIQSDAGQDNCSNIKCHSNGNIDGTITYQANNDFTWLLDNGTIGCANCHGNGTVAYPTYANAGIGNNSNSHLAHSTIACGECHASVSTNGTSIDGTTPANHVNMSIDVSGPQFTWVAGSETCNTIICHGSGSAQWGATALNCGSCHQHATADTDDFTYGNAISSVIATNEWVYSGHGKASGSYDVTGHPAANFPGAAGAGDPCKYCHDGSVTHNDANYFRLRQNGKADLNGACLGCHETGAAGVDPDGGLTVYGSKNATVKVNKYHQGAKHGDPRDGGRWCWDCHDPHGDAINATTRIQMIQRRAQVNPNAYGVPPMPLTSGLTSTDIVFYNNTLGASAAGGFARTAAQTPVAAGLCNACHTTTQNPDTTALYRATTHTGTHSTAVCTTCHKHNPDNAYDGLAFQGSGCNGCHGSTGNGQYWPDGSGGNPVYADSTAGAHNNHVTAIGAYLGYGNWATVMYNDTQQKAICAFCHPSPGGSGHDANNAPVDTVDVLAAGQFLKFTGIGATSTDTGSGAYASGSCATSACHNGVATPGTWNTPPAGNCTTTCHNPNLDATAREGHLKHVNGKGYACTECHVNNGTNNGHINGEVNLVFNNPGSMENTYGTIKGDGSYSQAANSVPRDLVYGNCGNMYCHADKLSPNWNLTIAANGCTACHTTGGAASLNPTSGLHIASVAVKHDETLAAGSCVNCHTTAPTTVAANHINGSLQSATAITYAWHANVTAYVPATGCQAAIACHTDGGGWKRKWAGFTDLKPTTGNPGDPVCDNCHGDTTLGWRWNEANGTTTDHTDPNGLAGDSVTGSHGNCQLCHGWGDAGYNKTWQSGQHGDGLITMNGPSGTGSGYNNTTGRCDTQSCHGSDASHQMNTNSIFTANFGNYGAGTCSSCHGGGTVTGPGYNYWPDNATYPDKAGRHLIHITRLAAQLGITLASATDLEQKRMCAYCHEDPNHLGTNGQAGHADNLAPVGVADVADINAQWAAGNPPSPADVGASFNTTDSSCAGIDCHNNVTATAGTFGWRNASTSTCAMCHTNGATDAPHVAHLAPAMGTVTCLACHGAGTTTSTAPTAGHLDGTLSVVGTLIGTAVNGTTVNYSGGLNGTCGTVNACHTTGVYNGSVLTTPKGGTTFTWGVTTFAGCDACHETTSTLASGSHANHMLTTSQSGAGAITCNSCHTAATVATHMNQSINFTGAATNYGTESMFNTTYLGNCGTNTCHNNGKNGAPYNNGLGSYAWNNNAIGAGLNTCTECHGYSGATLTSEAHDTHLLASTGVFGGTAMTCSSCHTAATAATHVDQTIQFSGLTYGGDVGITGTTFGSCGTNACHKNGRGGAPEVTSYDWNTIQADCSICHLAKPTTGAHNTHLTAVAWGPYPAGTTFCDMCHLANNNNTTMAGKTTHINNTISFNGPSEVATGAMATDTGVTACSACHGNITAANAAGGAKKSWAAATRLACETCHGAYSVATRFADGTGVAAPLNAGASYTTYGHNKVTNNPTYGGKACTDCHSNTVAHISNTLGDAERLKTVNTQTYSAATNNFCGLACHTGTAENIHYANGGTGASDDGILCMTCHNPHGQNGNQDAMIRSTIAGRAVTGFNSRATRTDYYNAGYTGVCQACHDGAEVGHFSRSQNDTAHFSPQVCTDCHKHLDSPGFKASGGACNSCHGYPPVQQTAGAGAPYGTKALVEDYDGGGRAHALLGHINPATLPDPALNSWAPCTPCHDSLTHNMGYGVGNLAAGRQASVDSVNETTRYPRVNVDAAYDKGGSAFYNMKATDNAAGMGYCSNVSCHFGESPKWDCNPTSKTNDPQ